MSFPKNDRNFQPESGKVLPRSFFGATVHDFDFTFVVAKALHQAFGGTHAAVKTVSGFTGANERTVRNWFEGKNAPNGMSLVKLARYSDEVLEAFLLMAGRDEILSAKKLVDARDKLVEMLDIIDQLREG
jgi:hypothetical protein